MMNSPFRSLGFWRGWALVASAVAVVALAIALRPLLTTQAATDGAGGARIDYVAVLHDQTSQQSTLLITWDAKNCAAQAGTEAPATRNIVAAEGFKDLVSLIGAPPAGARPAASKYFRSFRWMPAREQQSQMPRRRYRR